MNRRIYAFLAFALSFLILFPDPASLAESGARPGESYDFRLIRFVEHSITPHESYLHVEFLAADEMRGRKTGTPGQWLAAKYIASEFSKYGLKPAGQQNRYYQNFQVQRRRLVTTDLWLVHTASSTRKVFAYKLDYQPFDFSGANRVTVPIVFAGYGITAPEYGYDDYRDLDVSGKIVLVLRHEPQEHDPRSVFAGLELTQHAYFETKALNALRHGAVGLLLVTDPAGHHDDDGPRGAGVFNTAGRRSRKWQLRPNSGLATFPALWVDPSVAEALLQPTGHTLLELQRRIDADLKPVSFNIPSLEVHVNVAVQQDVRKTENVLALLPGSDPVLRDEVVVIGAHYDHIGVRQGKIYNGADDNASGTSGLLEIAEAFAELSTRPRRSILFIAFSAEEMGLLGSEYYVEHPVFPLDQTVAMINLDMIGRNAPNAVDVVGSNRSPELHAINVEANHEIGLRLTYNGEKYFSRSDQANFAKHGIPVLFYNTGDHPDYHRPSDVVSKVNPTKIARIARLAFLVAWEVANSEHRPTYRALKPR